MASVREADLAFVLEGVEGVIAVYGLDGAWRANDGFMFAVRIAPGGRVLAAAHSAILRVLSHEECRRVMFFQTVISGRLAARARVIELTATERELARARVMLASRDDSPTMRPRASSSGLSVLLVEDDREVERVLSTGPGAERIARLSVYTEPAFAVPVALDERFDIMLCGTRFAFGPAGFLERLLSKDAVVAASVSLLSIAAERAALRAKFDELFIANPVLEKALGSDILQVLARPERIAVPWSIPVPGPRRPLLARERPDGRALRVLVVDEDPSTKILLSNASDDALDVEVTDDTWEALKRVCAKDVDIILCSVTMQASLATPLYRFLWKSAPEMKSRFVLVLSPDAVPRSGATASKRLVERPLTRDSVHAAVESFLMTRIRP